MASPPIVVIAGVLQQQPVGEILCLRGDLDAGAYKIYSSTSDLIIQPGTDKALRASLGGNARGANAVDLQQTRANDTQVASGISAVIGGGERNLASGEFSTVAGGRANLVTAAGGAIGGGGFHSVIAAFTFVGGGQNNDVAGRFGAILGGRDNVLDIHSFAGVIGGGWRNNIDSDYGVIGGGYENFADSDATYSVIGGGYQNQILASFAFIGGGSGNIVGSGANYGAIIGGADNIVSVSNGCICGGQLNSISGTHGFIGGGENNDIQNQHSSICGGLNNLVQGDYSAILGGQGNITTAEYSTAMGYYAKTTLQGEVAQASGRFAATGDAQTSTLVARNQSVDASDVVLYLDGSTATLDMPEDASWMFNIYVAAHRDTAVESSGWHLEGVIRRAGSANPVIVGTRIKTPIAQDDGTWDADVRVDTVNDALEIYVNGAVGKNINWVARIELVVING